MGSNVDGPSPTLPADGVLQFSFDRYLLPTTITRQSYVVLDGGGNLLATVPFKTLYDPVARTVTIAGPEGPGRAWLLPDQIYRVVFAAADPSAATDVGGLRAIDRAPLAAPRSYVFRVTPPTGATAYEPEADFCGHVLPLFVRRCGDGTCHGATPAAASGLVLASPDGLRLTALARVAQGSATAGLAATAGEQGPLFGVQMAVIKPGDPGSSWLMYKVELAPHPSAPADAGAPLTCGTDGPSPGRPPRFVPLAAARIDADADERRILNGYVLGAEMPYPSAPPVGAHGPLTFDEREALRLWIARGANVTACPPCAPLGGP